VEGPRPQYTAKTLDDYLEHMSKPVFQAGISWRVVDAKWPTIKAAFHRFKIARVARMSDPDVGELVKDTRVIRSRPKIAAIVHNAGEIMAIERETGFKKYLRSFDDYAALEKDLKKRFKFLAGRAPPIGATDSTAPAIPTYRGRAWVRAPARLLASCTSYIDILGVLRCKHRARLVVAVEMGEGRTPRPRPLP